MACLAAAAIVVVLFLVLLSSVLFLSLQNAGFALRLQVRKTQVAGAMRLPCYLLWFDALSKSQLQSIKIHNFEIENAQEIFRLIRFLIVKDFARIYFVLACNSRPLVICQTYESEIVTLFWCVYVCVCVIVSTSEIPLELTRNSDTNKWARGEECAQHIHSRILHRTTPHQEAMNWCFFCHLQNRGTKTLAVTLPPRVVRFPFIASF